MRPNAHSRIEQHREPGRVAVVGPAVVRAELELAEAADRDADDEDQKDGDASTVNQPASSATQVFALPNTRSAKSGATNDSITNTRVIAAEG